MNKDYFVLILTVELGYELLYEYAYADVEVSLQLLIRDSFPVIVFFLHLSMLRM